MGVIFLHLAALLFPKSNHLRNLSLSAIICFLLCAPPWNSSQLTLFTQSCAGSQLDRSSGRCWNSRSPNLRFSASIWTLFLRRLISLLVSFFLGVDALLLLTADLTLPKRLAILAFSFSIFLAS